MTSTTDRTLLLRRFAIASLQESATAAAFAYSIIQDEEEALRGPRTRPYTIQRRRADPRSFQNNMSDYYFKRSFRMSKTRFNCLVDLLSPYISGGGQAVNGPITASMRVGVAIRYFAGGSSYDLMGTNGIGHSTVYDCVWQVVDAVHECSELNIVFPQTHVDQHQGLLKNSQNVLPQSLILVLVA